MRKSNFIILFTLFATMPAIGQSLYQDANAMLEAIKVLEKPSLDKTIKDKKSELDTANMKVAELDSTGLDSVKLKAAKLDTAKLKAELKALKLDSAKLEKAKLDAPSIVLAILHNYEHPLAGDSIVAGSWENLRESYAKNPQINGLLADSLFTFDDLTSATVANSARRVDTVLKAGQRQKIMLKLHAEQAISPADYLSVSSTMERYRTPVTPPMEAMRTASENSNSNIKGGVLTSQAAIIEGIALFILDRAKDEVIINFLDRLVNDETPEFKKLFPTVVTEFAGTDFGYSNAFLGRLRQAFYEDIQTLSIRLPLLMLDDDYFAELQAEPIAYNLLVLYSMASLTQSGLSLEEAVPVTNRYLYEGFLERTKEVNLTLADKAAQSGEYAKLIVLADTACNQMKWLFKELNNAEYSIDTTIEGFQISFPSAADPPYSISFLGKPSYRLGVIFGEEDNPFGINMLPQLLAGQLDEKYMQGYTTLESYDKFFGTERTVQQWRATGLELAQKLNGTWYNDQRMSDILFNWQNDIVLYHNAAQRWMEESDSAGIFTKAKAEVETDRKKLLQLVLDDKSFWTSNAPLTHDNGLAFNALANLLTTAVFTSIDDNVNFEVIQKQVPDSLAELEKLERKKAHLQAVETRLAALDTILFSKKPTLSAASPLRKYLVEKKAIEPYAFLKAHISDLEGSLRKIETQLKLLEKQFAPTTCKARDNAGPILQATEMVTNLMYCLRSNDHNQQWLTRSQLDTMLDGGRRQAVFLGLMQQRLASTKGVGPISASGLADLVQLTIKDIQLLPPPNQPDAIAARDTMAFYRKSAFAIHTLNRLLELPLVMDSKKPGKYTPLKDRSPGLAQVPEIAERTLDFIYYVNVKDHGHAISSLIRVFTHLDLGIDEQTIGVNPEQARKLAKAVREEKRKLKDELKNLEDGGVTGAEQVVYTKLKLKIDSLEAGDTRGKMAIAYLKKYGDFIAGLIDAKKEQQVKELLKQIADPPGSSRIKRQSAISASLNAYLGGTYGHEIWEGAALLDKKNFNSLAPTMPVGISLSGLFGKKETSLSIFASFLDVGALLSYQPTSVDSAEVDFTFKNVFKPGVQLHWNLKKSPFYLGLGWQYGRQFVNVQSQQESVGANRYFIGFGVDVPILTLYQR